MNVVRWKPWRPFGDLVSMHNQFGRMLDRALYEEESGEADTQQATWYPVTDVYETQEAYIFKMEVPGIQKDDIGIEFKDNNLVVKGERKVEKEVKDEDYHRMESFSGSFFRSFKLPDSVDPQKIKAELKNGILKLTVAKAEEKKPHAIPISFN